MKKLLSFSFSKVYVIAMILISLLVVGSYFSYAMFTVSKERSNAISIVTGNLIYDLTVDGEDIESLVVPAGTTKVFTVTLSNPNNRIARFNFYYLGSLPDGVITGYSLLNGVATPSETGVNLEKSGTSGSSNIYRIVVVNKSENEITINLGVSVGLDYNDLSLPSNGHLFEEYKVNLSDIVLTSPGENGDTYDDGTDTFITGTNPDNYIWYSGKLWRAVSVNNEEKTTKLITQWNISVITYNSSGNTTFKDSYMEDWLNDITVDGFLGNLREPEKFIKMDSKWNATMMTDTSKPPSTTLIEDSVGLLNLYEYQVSYRGTDYSNGYLNNNLYWWTLTPYDTNYVQRISSDGSIDYYSPSKWAYGIRPSVNLKKDVQIVDGDGTESNPYRLVGDNDQDLSGVKLNTRYSGEYISFGTGDNNLYRIVSHEVKNLTKITSADPLKENGAWETSAFGSNVTFSSNNTIGTFLNGTYLNSYLTAGNRNMIVTNNTWYLGTVATGANYRLAKYTNTSMSSYAKSTTSNIGLLRLGELMAGQFNNYDNNTYYWTLTPESTSYIKRISNDGHADAYSPSQWSYAIKPSFNLKENVIITGGDGTKENPFELALE